jgi:hypothetical protein
VGTKVKQNKQVMRSKRETNREVEGKRKEGGMSRR